MEIKGKRFPKEILPFLYILLDNYKSLNKQINNPATQLLADNIGMHLNNLDTEYLILNFQDFIDTRLESVQDVHKEFLFMYKVLHQMQICYANNSMEDTPLVKDNLDKFQICLKHYYAVIIALDMIFTTIAHSKINIDPKSNQVELLDTKFYILPEFPVYVIELLQECDFKTCTANKDSAESEFINLTALSLRDTNDLLKRNVINAFRAIVSLKDIDVNQIILNSAYR